MSDSKQRFGLGLERFKPTPKGSDGAGDSGEADAVARRHGFTSREESEAKGADKPKQGRPTKKTPRRQLNFVAHVDDYDWWVETRDARGVNGAKLFSDMRAAYEKLWGDRDK